MSISKDSFRTRKVKTIRLSRSISTCSNGIQRVDIYQYDKAIATATINVENSNLIGGDYPDTRLADI
ncbi:MAG: hypothetical protein IAA97_00090 [Spirochaetes bacterium]|uniref:Uncharacterized protein n=1 Tax=Candidatus Ornithospirochaeta stercoripullorum TaxID=2840899 RepID=A0A9D9DWT7_9SPIO|nr:hypothetical protein [Candidatus Ornithospirochaeta stercoripullorum]